MNEQQSKIQQLTEEMRANAAALANARALVARLEAEAVDLTRRLIAAHDEEE